jgi:hypothetical protein
LKRFKLGGEMLTWPNPTISQSALVDLLMALTSDVISQKAIRNNGLNRSAVDSHNAFL